MLLLETFDLKGLVVGWKILEARNRVREVDLPAVPVRAVGLDQLFAVVAEAARAALARHPSLSDVRVTVLFRTDGGVEAKVSYLAERD